MTVAQQIAKLTLNGHQRALVNRMAERGIHYPVWTLKVRDQVARQTHGVVGLPLACALLEQESGGGRNVWGHDPAPNGGTSSWGGQSVSRGGYLAYRARRGSHGQGGMQGVGPCQLTYYSYQDRADQQGGCWEPRANMFVGLSDLASQIVGHGHREGIRAYNGTGAAAERYADSVLALERKWTGLLDVAASKPAPKPPAHRPAGAPADLPAKWYGHWSQPWHGIHAYPSNYLRWLVKKGHLSPHFTLREAACHDGTAVPARLIGGAHGAQAHAFQLERLRHAIGDRPIPNTSWYRTPAHNRAVGGASQSQHIQGDATDHSWAWVDSIGRAKVQAAAERIFANDGIGTEGSGHALHLDSRGQKARWVTW